MEKITAKKVTAGKAAKKGFYIVIPERKGAGASKNDKYTESQRSYYARRYMQIHSARSTAEKDD